MSFKKTVDKAIKICDEEEKWITIKGSHVKIDGEGNIIEGNENLKQKLKNKSKAGNKSEKSKKEKVNENSEVKKFGEKEMKMVGEALYNSGVSRNVKVGLSQLLDVDEDDEGNINKALNKIQSYASENGKKVTMSSVLGAVDRLQDELDGAKYYKGKIKKDDERWNNNKDEVINKVNEKLEKYGLSGIKLNESESKSQGGGHYRVVMNFKPKRVGGSIAKSEKVIMNVKISNRRKSVYAYVDEFEEM